MWTLLGESPGFGLLSMVTHADARGVPQENVKNPGSRCGGRIDLIREAAWERVYKHEVIFLKE